MCRWLLIRTWQSLPVAVFWLVSLDACMGDLGGGWPEPSGSPWWPPLWSFSIGVLPDYVDQLHTICIDASCNYQQLTAGQLETLNGLGWSLDQYAGLQVVLNLVSISVSLGRQRAHRLAPPW